MSKSMYSLILNDEVVAQIDRMAYRQGTSRSEMITRILAQAVSMETPEMRKRDILARAHEILSRPDNDFRVQSAPTDSNLTLRSALVYKYNPTVYYTVELFRQPTDEGFGRLKIYMRTQNSELLSAFRHFASLYAGIESRYVNGSVFRESPGKIERGLSVRVKTDAYPETQTLGQAISDYIDLTDRCIKAFFSGITVSYEYAVSGMEDIYKDFVNRHSIIV